MVSFYYLKFVYVAIGGPFRQSALPDLSETAKILAFTTRGNCHDGALKTYHGATE